MSNKYAASEGGLMPLALTRQMFERETPVSLVSGIAQRNFYGSARDFCLDLGLDWFGIIRGEQKEVSRVAQIAGVDNSNLQRWTFRNVGKLRVRIGREMGTIRTVCRSIPRVCPACIRASVDQHGFSGAFLRADWQIVSIRTCDIHHVPLIRLPSRKHSQENYDIAAIIRERFDLITGHIDIHRQESSLETYLRTRLRGTPHAGFWPDCFTLPVVARAAESLGGRILYGTQVKFTHLSDDMLHAAGAKGFDILSGGADALKSCLDDLTRESSDSQKFHRRDYGMFLTWLSSSRAAPEMKLLKSVVRDHIIESFPIKSGAIVLGTVVKQPRLLSVTDAARELRMKPDQFLRFQMANGESVSTGAVERQGVRVDLLPALKDQIDDQITIKEAMRILNCSFDLVQKLADCRILPFHTRGGKARYISRRDAHELLRAVEDLPATRQHGNFLTAAQVRERIACKASEILTLFMQGELSPTYRDKRIKGINALLVDLEQVRSKITNRDPKFILFTEALGILRLRSAELHSLASMGYLRMTSRRDPDSGCMRKVIEAETLDRFRARFATLVMLAVELHRRSPHLRKDLEALGALPVCSGSDLPQFYERSKLPNLTLLFSRWSKTSASPA
ncbi:TniQ family protein [Paracoccus saliphilus]|uniref:TniQ family protein n=1 Tax=Paracoccus saliphilus TaxID=405559 RepID=A0AA46A703_9RHOB|nr:TniQ family protein [Paracoccus saliphilus]WCR03944.1 TniQ family protein [Paracoccus saliphilus]SIT05986.1 TniQ protein [Paracoccus saliphilus]